MSEEKKMPKNWTVVSTNDICSKITDGSHFSPKSCEYGYPYVTVKDIRNDKIDFDNCLKISEEDYWQLLKNDCQPLVNDLLFSKDGTVGKVALISFDKEFVVLSSIAILRTDINLISPKFLFHILKSSKFLHQALDQKKGVAIRRLILRDLKELELPLPPLPEQHRIVAKIEELFSSLDKGIESLKTAQQQLKVYRQAVLKWAFEGKLTEIERERGKFPDATKLYEKIKGKGKDYGIKLKYPKINSNDDLPVIPNEWIWVRNEELLKYVTSGSRDWKKYYSDSGSIFIRTQNIKTNNLELNDVAFVSLPAKAEGKRSLVEMGDLLMTITGANVGKVAFIEKQIPEAYVSQSVALMKYLDTDLTKYMWYYFQCHHFGEGLINGLVYGVGRPVLSLENMKEVPVALCSLEEQQRIVSEIESRLSVCDKIEESITTSLQQAEALRQSILKKAFEGKLVEQDPNDEPAAVLLERIKEEREALRQAQGKNKAVKKVKNKKVKAL